MVDVRASSNNSNMSSYSNGGSSVGGGVSLTHSTPPAGDLSGSFRQRAAYMKTWKPASQPSNRDRLELYALHKQAASGDAPSALSTQTAGERAKYQAWKQKSGMSQSQAMRLYLEESDRQVRVYGTTTQTPACALTPENTPLLQQENGGSVANGNSASAGSPTHSSPQQQPRGLAAIPLLCAAASESRQAYLRRLANTRLEQAWWSRQEPLCATPGALLALPERLLLSTASGLEYISLIVNPPLPGSNDAGSSGASTAPSFLPPPVIQSFLWPAHNALLALWIGVILVATTWTAAFQLLTTLLWGSRRTGHSLPAIWKDNIFLSANSIHALTERHQPLTARLTGLLLLPFTVLVAMTNSLGGGAAAAPLTASSTPSSTSPALIWTSLLYDICMAVTWWYWFLMMPWLATCLFSCAFVAGGCFALIELAGV